MYPSRIERPNDATKLGAVTQVVIAGGSSDHRCDEVGVADMPFDHGPPTELAVQRRQGPRPSIAAATVTS